VLASPKNAQTQKIFFRVFRFVHFFEEGAIMPEPINKTLVDSSTVAKLFNLTTRRVLQLVQENIITAVRIKGDYKYDLPAVTQQYIKHLQDKASGRDMRSKFVELDGQKLDAEINYKRSRARMAELELKELEGRMHRAEDVEALMTDHVLAVRSALLALPGRLAVDLAEIKTAAEAAERVKREVYSILEELANYQYDPAEYRRRVRERQGWQDRHGDEDDE